MDKSKHTVTLPISDYMELTQEGRVVQKDIDNLIDLSNAWSIYVPGPGQRVTLSLTDKVPYYHQIGEIHVYDKQRTKLLMKYKVVPIEE